MRRHTSRRKGIVAAKTKTPIVTTSETPVKRKSSVLDWIAEPRPRTPPHVTNADIVPPIIVEVLEHGEIKVKRRVYNQFSPVSVSSKYTKGV